MKKNKIWLIGLLILIIGCIGDKKETVVVPKIKQKEEIFQPNLKKRIIQNEYYDLAFQEIAQMLEGKIAIDFKRAVFLIEWAYLQGDLDYAVFCQQVSKIGNDLKQFIQNKGVGQYKTSGNYALFEYFTKPHQMNNFKPFIYDFDDFYGKEDYRNVFVSKLMETHKGQCRSMPMLYKILAEEIGTESYLATAPNHLYIKHLDEQGKWVNIELTNGNFSSDSWMISSMDITAESIRKGVYMKALDDKENIAFCMLELALAHQHKHGHNDFSLMCTNLALKHFPECMSALMNKFNILRDFGLKYIEKYGKTKSPYIVENYKAFKATEKRIEELGFRELSGEKYAAWVKSMQEEQQKRLSQLK